MFQSELIFLWNVLRVIEQKMNSVSKSYSFKDQFHSSTENILLKKNSGSFMYFILALDSYVFMKKEYG